MLFIFLCKNFGADDLALFLLQCCRFSADFRHGGEQRRAEREKFVADMDLANTCYGLTQKSRIPILHYKPTQKHAKIYIKHD